MPYSRQDILTQNINTYPNNNSGQITPDSVKSFNQNWIDSVVFTDQTGSLVVVSASYASNAGAAQTAISASRAVSSSFATTASFLTGNVANAVNAQTASFVALAQTASFTPNAIVTASVNISTITFTKGDNTQFSLTVAQSGSVSTASLALDSERLGGKTPSQYVSSVTQLAPNVAVLNITQGDGTITALTVDNVASASYAATADFTPNAFVSASNIAGNNNIALTRGNGSGEIVTINNVQSASFADTSTSASFATTASFALNAGTTVNTGSLATTASLNAYTGSTNTFTSSIQAQVTGLQSATSSYVRNAQTSSMSVLSASFASTAGVALTVQNGLNISASNITVTGNETILGNLTVNGTASFGYTKTTTGSAVIIGDEFIILNADTPTAPFAGIIVYDTGSNATASFEWNGINDYWITVEETGASSGILTGASGSKGAEVFPALNRLTKGTGNNTIIDSNITDNGTNVSINSNTTITGSVSILDSASVLQIIGNGFGQSSLVSPNGALVITPGLYGVQINGAYPDLQVNGNVTSTGTNSYLTGSLLGTASFANNAISASFASTASFALNVSQVATGSFATTGSNTFNGNQVITGSLSTTGDINIAQTGKLVAHDIQAASVAGVEILNNTSGVVALFGAGGSTGMTLYGQLNATSFSGSGALVTGVISSSYASNAQSATSASYALTASFASNVPETASFAISASFANNAGAAQTAISSSFATNAGTAISASFASTAAAAQTATSASYASNAQTAFSATSASFATTASFALTTAGGLQGSEIYSYTFLLMGA